MKKLLLVIGLVLFFPAFAGAVSWGSAVKATNGTIYLLEGGVRRGFPTPEVLFSHGFGFADALSATAEDLALPEGGLITFAEGSLVKTSTNPTVYLISDSKKRPFTSGAVFTGLKYSFANVLVDKTDILNNLMEGEKIDDPTKAHPAGTLVNENGTIYLVTTSGKRGIPSAEIFNSYRFRFEKVVLAKAADKNLPDEELVQKKDKGSAAAVPPPAPVPSVPVPVSVPDIPVMAGVTAGFPLTSYTFSFSFSHPNGGNLDYTIDWGDHEVATGAVASGASVKLAHGWSYLGEYLLKVTAKDSKGVESAATQKIIIDNDTTKFGPAVTVVTPNGGETYAAGQGIAITWRRNWSPQQSFEKVDIYYRRASVNYLIKSGAVDGGFNWTPSGISAAADYKVEVVSQGTGGAGSIISDQSDGFFSLVSVLGAIQYNY